MQERILTSEQVAQILQVHPFTVLKFIKQGKLQASKLGRVYRIREKDLEHFLDHTSGRTPKISESEPAEATKPILKIKNKNKSPQLLDKVGEAPETQVNKASPPKSGGDDHYFILK